MQIADRPLDQRDFAVSASQRRSLAELVSRLTGHPQVLFR